jgi:hypothetical protein
MPSHVENSEKINNSIWSIFSEPPKIVGYLLTLGLVIPIFSIPLNSILLIFEFSWIIALANAGYLAFVERDHRKKIGSNVVWLCWLGVMTIGAFACDFVGIYIHAMVGFHEGDSKVDLTYWKMISIVFPMVGTFTLSAIHSITKKIDDKKVSQSLKMFLVIVLVVLLVVLMWQSYQNNPQDLVKIMSNSIVKSWNP